MEKLDPYKLPSVRAPQWDDEGYCYLYIGVTERRLQLLAGCEDDEQVKNVLASQDPSLCQEEVVDVTMVEDGEQYPYTAVVKCKGARLALIHFLENHMGHDLSFTRSPDQQVYEGYCPLCSSTRTITREALEQVPRLSLTNDHR